jgi:hypothetical protein
MRAIRIAWLPIAIWLPIALSGCVNLDSAPPISKSGRVVVNFTNQGLSAWSDIPMGAYRIPNSQVIVSGYQEGGINIGTIHGIVTVAPTVSGGSQEGGRAPRNEAPEGEAAVGIQEIGESGRIET